MTKDGWQDPEEKQWNPKDLKQIWGQWFDFSGEIFKEILIIVFLSAHTGKSVECVFHCLSGKGKVPFKFSLKITVVFNI